MKTTEEIINIRQILSKPQSANNNYNTHNFDNSTSNDDSNDYIVAADVILEPYIYGTCMALVDIILDPYIYGTWMVLIILRLRIVRFQPETGNKKRGKLAHYREKLERMKRETLEVGL